MKILMVDTGDKKLDEAYKRMQVHISQFETFEAFHSYFNDVVKTDDYDRLSKWLLKVLFWEFKHGRTETKHDFDVMIEKLEVSDSEKAQRLRAWLEQSLKEVGGVS